MRFCEENMCILTNKESTYTLKYSVHTIHQLKDAVALTNSFSISQYNKIYFDKLLS